MKTAHALSESSFSHLASILLFQKAEEKRAAAKVSSEKGTGAQGKGRVSPEKKEGAKEGAAKGKKGEPERKHGEEAPKAKDAKFTEKKSLPAKEQKKGFSVKGWFVELGIYSFWLICFTASLFIMRSSDQQYAFSNFWRNIHLAASGLSSVDDIQTPEAFFDAYVTQGLGAIMNTPTFLGVNYSDLNQFRLARGKCVDDGGTAARSWGRCGSDSFELSLKLVRSGRTWSS